MRPGAFKLPAFSFARRSPVLSRKFSVRNGSRTERSLAVVITYSVVDRVGASDRGACCKSAFKEIERLRVNDRWRVMPAWKAAGIVRLRTRSRIWLRRRLGFIRVVCSGQGDFRTWR